MHLSDQQRGQIPAPVHLAPPSLSPEQIARLEHDLGEVLNGAPVIIQTTTVTTLDLKLGDRLAVIAPPDIDNLAKLDQFTRIVRAQLAEYAGIQAVVFPAGTKLDIVHPAADGACAAEWKTDPDGRVYAYDPATGLVVAEETVPRDEPLPDLPMGKP